MLFTDQSHSCRESVWSTLIGYFVPIKQTNLKADGQRERRNPLRLSVKSSFQVPSFWKRRRHRCRKEWSRGQGGRVSCQADALLACRPLRLKLLVWKQDKRNVSGAFSELPWTKGAAMQDTKAVTEGCSTWHKWERNKAVVCRQVTRHAISMEKRSNALIQDGKEGVVSMGNRSSEIDKGGQGSVKSMRNRSSERGQSGQGSVVSMGNQPRAISKDGKERSRTSTEARPAAEPPKKR